MAEIKPDYFIVYADRFEGLAAVVASSQMSIPTIHIEGGDITEGGALDDSVRHAMTKLSHFHFTTNKEASKRIIKMGEEKWRVNTIGIINLKDLKSQKIYTNNQIRKKLGLDLKNKTLLVTLHPTTLDNMNLKKNLITLLKSIKDTKFQAIFTYPNSNFGWSIKYLPTIFLFDASSNFLFLIDLKIKKFVSNPPQQITIFFEYIFSLFSFKITKFFLFFLSTYLTVALINK